MRRPLPLSIACCAFFLLTACTASPPPKVAFVGVASGSLATPLSDLAFTGVFPDGVVSVTAAVKIDHSVDGTKVMASWFHPDDREPPFGRRTLVIASGATVARFNLENPEGFPKGMYLLQVQLFDEGNAPAGSGSVAFSVDMTEKDLQEYQAELNAWNRGHEKKRP